MKVEIDLEKKELAIVDIITFSQLQDLLKKIDLVDYSNWSIKEKNYHTVGLIKTYPSHDTTLLNKAFITTTN